MTAGLLERRPDTRDKRLRRMVVTEPGRDLLSRARPAVHAVEQRMTISLGDADLAVLRGRLTDCARNLMPPPGEIFRRKTT